MRNTLGWVRKPWWKGYLYHPLTHAHSDLSPSLCVTHTHTHTESEGFAGFRNGTHVNSIHCNGTLRTAIAFHCNLSAVWNPTHTDVTNYVEDFSWVELADPCLVSRSGHTLVNGLDTYCSQVSFVSRLLCVGREMRALRHCLHMFSSLGFIFPSLYIPHRTHM